MENTNYRKGNTTLWIALLIMSVFFICCSCGSRKVEKTVVKTQESEVTTHTKIDTTKSTSSIDRNILVVDSSASEEFTITPIDSSKEMVVNGKRYLNSVLKYRKSKNNITYTIKEANKKIVQNAIRENTKSVTDKQIKIDAASSDRKQYDWTKTIVVIAILLGIAFWFLWIFFIRKNKEKTGQII